LSSTTFEFNISPYIVKQPIFHVIHHIQNQLLNHNGYKFKEKPKII